MRKKYWNVPVAFYIAGVHTLPWGWAPTSIPSSVLVAFYDIRTGNKETRIVNVHALGATVTTKTQQQQQQQQLQY